MQILATQLSHYLSKPTILGKCSSTLFSNQLITRQFAFRTSRNSLSRSSDRGNQTQNKSQKRDDRGKRRETKSKDQNNSSKGRNLSSRLNHESRHSSNRSSRDFFEDKNDWTNKPTKKIDYTREQKNKKKDSKFDRQLLNVNITRDMDLKNDVEVITGLYPVYSILYNNSREIFNLCVRISNEANHAENKQLVYNKLFQLAKERNIPLVEIPSKVFDEEFGNRKSQGVGLKCKKIDWHPIDTIEELVPSLDSTKPPIVVCLDRITDPVNLGSIIRTATYYGVCGIITEEFNTAPLNSICSTCSGGAIDLLYKHHQLVSTKDINQFLLQSQSKGWSILTTDVKDGLSVQDYLSNTKRSGDRKPIILVMGNEGLGVRQSVRKCCTDVITIPRPAPSNPFITGDDMKLYDSLNVNVSLAVLLNSLTNL